MTTSMNPMKTVFAGVLFLCIGLLHTSAFGQVFEGCTDIRGYGVGSIADYSLQDVANAQLSPIGVPIIRYNPNVLSSLAPQTRRFFYAHECGHHALGHNFGTTHPMKMEQAADCFAIRALVEQNLVNDYDIRVIQKDLTFRGKGDWTHLPGPQRAINLRSCLKSMEKVEIDATPDEDEDEKSIPMASGCPAYTTAYGYIRESCIGITKRRH